MITPSTVTTIIISRLLPRRRGQSVVKTKLRALLIRKRRTGAEHAVKPP
jgi:hypothetical protein